MSAPDVGAAEEGRCSMCAVGDQPRSGLHRFKYPCSNYQHCVICHRSGMPVGERCRACNRIRQEDDDG